MTRCEGIHRGVPICLPPELSLEQVYQEALALKPWRKGPFCFTQNDKGFCIDSEWQSYMKWDLIKGAINLEGLEVADIGCNNGYYLFCMQEQRPKSLVGFDPSPLCERQFHWLNGFLKTPILYEKLGVEDLRTYPKHFDVLFCLGVLYHRKDPHSTLKALFMGLKPSGVLVLDTLIYDSPLEVALCPSTYAKMSNVFFIPSPKALQNWAFKAGFKECSPLAFKSTDTSEQRKSAWIDGLSLESFLDPKDPTKSIEGYPAPLRGYFILRK
ncbi:tRNA U34 carboxymethyltransferase [Helicobacter sp. NHP19-012]|uniref:tRNA U34 carboxymethyltransferase n=1 Tax=Helicobacter gastrofelis TaxID=2849642 RepID=A0ABM7SG47_9HELI|nr:MULTISPECIES: tRNA 5-methoxyuridine(34)/uridine 5-oxyacetic acid(34) synthase CmoB [unclassified Helicobacter]BCZ19829.1 tRNA U34 carboxymethyltransferase [Helicobacter sp. NHP19-012]GMB95503.1 tRNA U34 carboxymethyltransferase [Helicobacter sp. NHP22-001]